MRHSTGGLLAAAGLILWASAGVAGQEKPGPTDPEIAHIAVTANQVDIDLAKLAKAKSGNAQVLRFAETMISDHTSVIEQATALVKQLGVTPAEHEVSRSLQSGGSEARTKLEGLTGAAFDAAYMEREVAYHQAVIDAVSQVLIPNAKNAQLKGLLEKVAPVLQGHLRHAKEVRGSLKK
jgi:putative membrane protein